MFVMKSYRLYPHADASMIKTVFHSISPNYCYRNNYKPYLAVIHYTAGGAAAGTVDWICNPMSKVSYHFIIDRNGQLHQAVPLNVMAYHAGESTWNNRRFVNGISVGIGLSNWGPIERLADNTYTTLDHPRHSLVLSNVDPTPRPPKHKSSPLTLWEPYPTAQRMTLFLLLTWLIDNFGIREIVGHDDIAPKRKIDPGPAFPTLPYLVPPYGYRPELQELLLPKEPNHAL